MLVLEPDLLRLKLEEGKERYEMDLNGMQVGTEVSPGELSGDLY